MKPKTCFPAVFALLASAAGLPALAAVNRTDLLGDPAPSSAATRTITIDENTKYVNVEGGEVVKFVAGDKAVTWSFDNPNVWAVNLRQIMPPGALDHKVVAYVGRNMLYDEP